MKLLTSREFNRDVSLAKRAAQVEPVLITDRGQPTHVLMSFGEYRAAAGLLGQPLRHVAGLAAQRAAGLGEVDVHAPFVRGGARARHQAGGLQPLQQRRERAGVEVEPLAEFAHRRAVLLPEHQHREVLRVGQAERLEQRLVQPRHRERGRMQREAELVVQVEPVAVRCGGGRHGLDCTALQAIRLCAIE